MAVDPTFRLITRWGGQRMERDPLSPCHLWPLHAETVTRPGSIVSGAEGEIQELCYRENQWLPRTPSCAASFSTLGRTHLTSF